MPSINHEQHPHLAVQTENKYIGGFHRTICFLSLAYAQQSAFTKNRFCFFNVLK